MKATKTIMHETWKQKIKLCIKYTFQKSGELFYLEKFGQNFFLDKNFITILLNEATRFFGSIEELENQLS